MDFTYEAVLWPRTVSKGRLCKYGDYSNQNIKWSFDKKKFVITNYKLRLDPLVTKTLKNGILITINTSKEMDSYGDSINIRLI